MFIFTVRILYITSIIRVRITFIKMLINRIGVWIHSHLHAAVKLAGFFSAGFACTDTCAEVCGVQALVLEPPTDSRSHRPDFPSCFPLLYEESVLLFWGFGYPFPPKLLPQSSCIRNVHEAVSPFRFDPNSGKAGKVFLFNSVHILE